MKRTKIVFSLFVITLLLSLFLATSVPATLTETGVTPADDATGVYVRTTLSVVLTESEGQTMNGSIRLVSTNDVLTLSAVSNGTQTLTIPTGNLPLEASTTYQWWVNTSNFTVWTNSSYNFTTGTADRARDYAGFNAQQIVLFGVLLIVMMLAVLVFIMDMMKEKKLDIYKLSGLLFAIILMSVVMAFI